jgi:hypothetical protein
MTETARLHGIRRMLGIGTAGAVLGIALSTGASHLGPILTVGSWLLLLTALHRFGRSGPDAPARGSRRRRGRGSD